MRYAGLIATLFPSLMFAASNEMGVDWSKLLSTKLKRTPVLKTEKRKVVAVIDSGIDMRHPDLAPYVCDGGHVDFVGTDMEDPHGHGTHVAGLVVKGLDPTKICIISLKYYDNSGLGMNNLTNEIAAIDWAISQKAVLINLSGGGSGYSKSEHRSITKALENGIKVVVAAGNEGRDMSQACSYYPACLPKHSNLFPVGSLDNDGKRLPSSNYGGPVVNWAPGLSQWSTLPKGRHGAMSGTSQATANFSNKLLGGEGKGYKR